MQSHAIIVFVFLPTCLGIWPTRAVEPPAASGAERSFLVIAAEHIKSAADSLHDLRHQGASDLPAGKSWGLATAVLLALGLACCIIASSWVISKRNGSIKGNLEEGGQTLVCGACEGREKPEKQLIRGQFNKAIKGPQANKPMMVEWFSLVFLQAFMITGIQVLVGVATGSLSLLADTIHGAMDAISYSVGTSVEISKSGKTGCCNPKGLDLLGACSNLATLLITSVWVSLEAFGELQHQAKKLQHEAENENPEANFQGPALIGFAFLGLFANVVLLILFIRWRIGRAVSSDAESCSCDNVDEYDQPRTTCDTIHALVHPGCNASGTCEPNNTNVNLNATTLHVVSDCFRSAIVLIAGFLITFSRSAWASNVDAFGALAITGFNVLGSLAVMRNIFNSFVASTPTARETDVPET